MRLEAGSTAREGLVELEAWEPRWLVVRRPSTPGAEWFVIAAESARDALRAVADDATVSAALALATLDATPDVSLDALEGVDTATSAMVVLAVPDRVVGLLWEGDAVPSSITDPGRGAVRVDATARRSVALAAPGAAHGVTAAGAMFSADAHIDGPARVGLGQPFELTISLSNPAAIAGEGRLTVMLEAGVTEFDLDVLLSARGFDCGGGTHATLRVDAVRLEDSRLSMQVTAVEPPPEVMRLVEAGETSVWEASITAYFEYRGNPVGHRVHRLLVQVDPSAGDPLPPEPVVDLPDHVEARGSALVFPDLPTPDLTMRISHSDPSDAVAGRYTVRLTSPHDTVSEDYECPLNLGQSAATWAGQAIQAIKKLAGPLAYEGLRGQGSRIANLLPLEFWALVNATLRHVADEEGRTPTVLLQTSDPHVPWELAHLAERPVDEHAPPFLAAQACVGRWILDAPNEVPMAPSAVIDVDNVTAVVGEYPESGRWPQLPQAKAEGEFLTNQFGATYRSAEARTVAALLNRTLRSPPQLMHFACHGTSDQSGNALMSSEQTPLYDFMFEASVAGREDRPFVFLNACRVGAADEGLARYGGFAATFLRSGFTGFIGPLWDVDDTIAQEIATSFYERAADGEPVSEILRSTRARFVDVAEGDDPPTTYMAYVFYGHPATTISGLRRKALS